MTGPFPTPHTIGIRRYIEDAENTHGNPVDAWSEPETVSVYGWAKPTSTEPKLAGHDRVVVDLEILAPPHIEVGPYDRLVVGGDEYTVEGEPEDYTHGPFGWQPGQVINATRVGG